MTIQVEVRADGEDASAARFGFTLTKKVGNSVIRNRARRRLREAVRLGSSGFSAQAGHDYVIVGRIEAVRLPFEALGRELAQGLLAVHERGRRRGKPRHQAGRNEIPALHADTPGHPTPERIRPKS